MNIFLLTLSKCVIIPHGRVTEASQSRSCNENTEKGFLMEISDQFFTICEGLDSDAKMNEL